MYANHEDGEKRAVRLLSKSQNHMQSRFSVPFVTFCFCSPIFIYRNYKKIPTSFLSFIQSTAKYNFLQVTLINMTLWKSRVKNEEAFFCKSSRPMHFSTQFSLVFKQMIFCLNGKVSVAAEDVLEIDNTIAPETFVASNMPDNKCHIHMWKSSSWGSNLDHNTKSTTKCGKNL